MKTRFAGLLLLISCLGLCAAPALAEFPQGVPDTFQVDLGGTFANMNTTAGVTSADAGVGPIVNLEEVFDLNTNQSTWRIDGEWRFTKRQHIDFGYFQMNRSGSRVNTDTFTWGDYTIKEGNSIDGSFDTSFIYGAYRYDFLQDPHVQISGSIGVSYMELDTSLTASGNVGTPNGNRNGTFSEDASFGFPVPLFGLQVNWAIGKAWEIEWYDRFLFVNQGDLSGNVNEASLRLKWYFLRNFGAAVGYDREDIQLRNYTSGDRTLAAGYFIGGWSAYLLLAF